MFYAYLYCIIQIEGMWMCREIFYTYFPTLLNCLVINYLEVKM